MAAIVLCDDDIAYTMDPIKIRRKSPKSINEKILALIMDPNPIEDNEANRNELFHIVRCLEVRNNESFS